MEAQVVQFVQVASEHAVPVVGGVTPPRDVQVQVAKEDSAAVRPGDRRGVLVQGGQPLPLRGGGAPLPVNCTNHEGTRAQG